MLHSAVYGSTIIMIAFVVFAPLVKTPGGGGGGGRGGGSGGGGGRGG